MTSMTKVFWWRDEQNIPQIIDIVVGLDGALSGGYSGQTEETLRRCYPTMEVTTVKEFAEEQEHALRTEPTPNTEENYIDALECLPPVDWTRRDGVESFKMSEMYCGRITTIHAVNRRTGTYWSFMDRCDLSHGEIVEKINAAQAAQSIAA